MCTIFDALIGRPPLGEQKEPPKIRSAAWRSARASAQTHDFAPLPHSRFAFSIGMTGVDGEITLQSVYTFETKIQE